MEQHIPKKPLAFGVFLTKLHKKWAIIAIFCVLAATIIDRIVLLVLENLTNSLAIGKINLYFVWLWAIFYVSLFFISQFFWRTSGFTGMRWFMGLRASAYELLYEYLTLHSKDYFNSRFAGSLANKISNAVEGTDDLFEKILWRFITLITGFIGFIVIAWIGNFYLGIITAVWTTTFLMINIWFAKKMQPNSFKFAKSLSTLKGRIVDSLSNISLVHEYTHVAGEREYIRGFVQIQHEAGIERWSQGEWILVGNAIMLGVFTAFMLWITIYLFQIGSVSIGVVVMIIALISNIISQLLFVGQDMRDSVRYYGEAKEGLEEILSKHLIVDTPDAIDYLFSKGEIAIESINFSYDGVDVFKDFSMKIKAGEKIGIVGKSGAGKTTFVSLLLRHFEIQKGVIKIDNKNIYEVSLESLRRAIAFVPQDTSLFHRTIKDNVQYSNPEANEEEIVKAAKLAQAHDFIMSLPKGYDTLVGERGIKLSGGQRQRIAIARAFLKNSPILILDEATSSLDSQSEHAIQISLEELMKKRTVIAIAHRLSTLKKMDRIVIISEGEIVEDGKPDELLKKNNGVFKKLWDHQVKGFIVDS